MFLTDITYFMSWFFSTTLTIVGTCFNILSSFEMFGTNLLVIILSFGVLSVLLSIVLPHLEMAAERADARVSEFRTKHHFW